MWDIISGPFISSLVFETSNNVNPSSKVQLLCLNETSCKKKSCDDPKETSLGVL